MFYQVECTHCIPQLLNLGYDYEHDIAVTLSKAFCHVKTEREKELIQMLDYHSMRAYDCYNALTVIKNRK